MQIYRGTIELLDYVFYATVERGKVYETGAFIHNYALTYALDLVRAKTYTYAQSKQKPHYREELTPLNGHVYLSPGAPQRVAYRLVQWNTIPERYAFPGKERSLGYPGWGFARVLRPGSRFIFYLMTSNITTLPDAPALQDLVAGRTVRVRLGKFLGKARLHLKVANEVQEKVGPFFANAFLNWRDLEVDPMTCDVVATSLPTRLLARAQFEKGPHYVAHFKDNSVKLPAHMRFLARPPS